MGGGVAQGKVIGVVQAHINALGCVVPQQQTHPTHCTQGRAQALVATDVEISGGDVQLPVGLSRQEGTEHISQGDVDVVDDVGVLASGGRGEKSDPQKTTEAGINNAMQHLLLGKESKPVQGTGQIARKLLKGGQPCQLRKSDSIGQGFVEFPDVQFASSPRSGSHRLTHDLRYSLL